jgi:hypothetical protein
MLAPHDVTIVSHSGKHRMEITETSKSAAEYKSGTSGVETLPSGKQMHWYDSDRLKVRIEDEVLTVNGNVYILLKKDDAIRIKDGRVWINGQPAKPEPDGEARAQDGESLGRTGR